MPGPKPWIKLWKEKILSSINIRQMTVFERGFYLWLMILARDEALYAGKLCYPNGIAVPDNELADEMSVKKKVFLANMEKLQIKGLVFRDEHGVWTIRKYDEHQVRFTDKDPIVTESVGATLLMTGNRPMRRRRIRHVADSKKSFEPKEFIDPKAAQSPLTSVQESALEQARPIQDKEL